MMFYNIFTGTSSLADAVWTLAQEFFRKFNVAGDVVNLYNSLLWKIRAIYNSVDGSFSWWDLGGVILDLGSFLVTFLPISQLANVISWLWTAAQVL